MSGKLIILCGPSGVGKSTLARAVMKEIDKFDFSISVTTRAPRLGEEDGTDYYFLTEDNFRRKLKAGEFLETEEVYDGLWYGTLRSEVDRIHDKGRYVMFDVDVKGGVNIKKQYSEEALSILIKPPSIQDLRKRLIERGTETPETLETRMNRVREELGYEDQFDISIVNDDLEKTTATLLSTVQAFLNE
jgi:guanylate kinase